PQPTGEPAEELFAGANHRPPPEHGQITARRARRPCPGLARRPLLPSPLLHPGPPREVAATAPRAEEPRRAPGKLRPTSGKEQEGPAVPPDPRRPRLAVSRPPWLTPPSPRSRIEVEKEPVGAGRAPAGGGNGGGGGGDGERKVAGERDFWGRGRRPGDLEEGAAVLEFTPRGRMPLHLIFLGKTGKIGIGGPLRDTAANSLIIVFAGYL
ncbi:unnamed protein product, partial [Urochloa humidicola]